jgi:hypothetical protein
VAEVSKLMDEEYKVVDPVTQQRRILSPGEAIEMDLATNMRLNNDSMSAGAARQVANDLIINPNGGRFKVVPLTGNPAKPGWGAVVDRRSGAKVGELNSYALQRYGATVVPASPGLAGTAGAR